MRWNGGAVLLALAGGALAQPAQRDLADLSLEELVNIRVTSVSGRAERLSDAPASIYVITADDIRRSGATSLPEALRLAPNLQVARIDAGQYAISARGFNNAIGNKLLVLVDGRTIYTPLFSGVFWDQQEVMLEDVERIEVISGPGATLWGANAVNGVINVTTRSARDTQGGLLSVGAGDATTGVGAYRYGATFGDNGHYRLYAKTSRQENSKTASGAAVPDGRDFGQAGFRTDWRDGRDSFTVQGDGYTTRAEERGTLVLGPFRIPLQRIEASGMNLLGRWTRNLGEGSDLSVQAYYDHSDRQDPSQYSPRSDVVDLQMQHGLLFGAHKLLWGAGYRHSDDYIQPGFAFAFVPRSRGLDWANLFAQGEMALSSSVQLTLGVKFESNDYSGVETLPSARLAWKLTERDLAWVALSRAVRAPARLDHDIRSLGTIPFPIIVGGDTFDSEIADVLEIGYRAQPTRTLSWSATAYVDQWDRLRSGQVAPARVQNMIDGTSYGFEAWGTWQATAAWRLMAGGTTLRKNLKVKPGSTDPTPWVLGNDPEYQWVLRSSLNIASNQDFDVSVRSVAALTNPAPDTQVRGYTALDLRYAWRVRRDLELSLTVQNAADPSHAEFGAAEVQRSFLLAARWSY